MTYNKLDLLPKEEREKYGIRMLTSPHEMMIHTVAFGWLNFHKYTPGDWRWDYEIQKVETIDTKFSIFFDGELIRESVSQTINVLPGDLIKYHYTITIPDYLKESFIPSHTPQQLTLDT